MVPYIFCREAENRRLPVIRKHEGVSPMYRAAEAMASEIMSASQLLSKNAVPRL